MKVKQIARLLAIVLTLVTMVSCLAVTLTFNASAADYMVLTANDLASKDSPYQFSVDTTGGTYKITTNGNDPYTEIASWCQSSKSILRDYPYLVVRYRSSRFTTLGIYCGNPFAANSFNYQISMPVVPTNGQWGCLFYDFSQFDDMMLTWFRLDFEKNVSGISWEIAEIAVFKNQTLSNQYCNYYSKAGGSGGCTAINASDFADKGNNGTGRSYLQDVNSDGVQIIKRFHAAFAAGGYYVSLTTNGGGDPMIRFDDNKKFDDAATKYKYLYMRYRTSTSGVSAKFYSDWSESYASSVSLSGDGNWHWVVFNVVTKSNPKCRLDFVDGINGGSPSGQKVTVDIAEMYFCSNENDVYNAGTSLSNDTTGVGGWMTGGMYFMKGDSNTYFTSVGKISGGTLDGNQRSATGSNFKYGKSAVTTVGRTLYKVDGTHSEHQENTNGTVTKDATCTAAGSTRYNCKLCNDETRVDSTQPAALGHNTSGTVDRKDATCTAAGVTGGTYCTRCNNGKTAAEKVLDALGHNIITSPAVAPTYTTVGHEAGTQCSRCSDATVQGKEIAKLNPILTYNIALNEKFALNVLYAHFDENATLSVNGTPYDGEIKNTGKTDDFGNPIYSIRIPDISARDINSGFLVQEVSQGESVTVSIASYCTAQPEYFEQQKQALINQKVEGGMSVEDATAAAEAELRPQMLAADVCDKITVYGQAAENYFNPGNTTDKHTALAGQIANYAPQNTTKAASNTGLVKFKSATVLYGDEIELVFIMDNYNREKIFVNDKEIPENEINSHLFKTVVSGKEYICFAIAVKPDEFSKTFTVRAGTWVMGEDGNNYYAGGSTASYSVDTYIASMQQKYAGKSDAQSLSTVNLVNALGNYGLSASTYVNN